MAHSKHFKCRTMLENETCHVSYHDAFLQDRMPQHSGSMCPPGFPSPAGAQPTFMKCPLAHTWGQAGGGAQDPTGHSLSTKFLPLRHCIAILKRRNLELVLRSPDPWFVWSCCLENKPLVASLSF